MFYLKDNPRENFHFEYLIVQSCNSPVDYYKRLIEATEKFRSPWSKFVHSVAERFGKVTSFKIPWVEIKIDSKSDSYLSKCKSIYKNLSTNGTILVVMIDEFAQAVDNIRRGIGDNEARNFLYANREIQGDSSDSNIRFIYTGSLGLEHLCKKLDATDSLNLINIIDVGPLSHQDALLLCKLILDGESIKSDDQAVPYLLTQIEWLIPFYVLLALENIIDNYKENGLTLDKAIVDKTIMNITGRRSCHYLDNYETHIKKIFEGIGKKYQFIRKFLKDLSCENNLTLTQIKEIAVEFNECSDLDGILEILEYEGYIYKNNAQPEPQYRFTSPILKIWWNRHM